MSTPPKRLLLIAGALGLLALALALVLSTLRSSLVFFRTPSELATLSLAPGSTLRVGGVVRPGSLQRAPGGERLHFVLSDATHSVRVEFAGSLPALFGEGREAVAQGVLDAQGILRASQVLARHDEYYRPAPPACVPPCSPPPPSSR